MESIKLITEITSTVQEVKKRGNKVIPIHLLEAYLEALKDNLIVDGKNQAEEDRRIAANQVKFQNDMEIYKVEAPIEAAQNLEMFKSVLEAGLSAIKAAIALNGGAAIALLTFLGQQPKGTTTGDYECISLAMLFFVGGAGAAGLSSGFRYLSQALYGATNKERAGDIFRNIAVFFAIVSYLAFILGGCMSYGFFRTY